MKPLIPLVVIVLFALPLLDGCKKKKIIKCAPGQKVIDGQCAWPPQPDTADGTVSLPDGGDDSADDTGVDVDEPDLSQADQVGPKDTADVSVEPGKVGDPCIGDESCESNLCLLAPGGYCSISPCDDDCPGGAVCLTLGTVKACFKECGADGDCRVADGYACKTVIKRRVPPQFVQVCRDTGDGKTGAACLTEVDCEGEQACLTTFKQGYCAKINCKANGDCADDQKCVLIEGIRSCMKVCATEGDCRTADNHTCVDTMDVDNQSVKVCSMKEGSAKIGESCEVNLDCLSKSCEILASGKCNDAKTLCKTNLDCPVFNGVSGICTQGKQVGMCVQSCDPLGEKCPDGNVCASNGAGYRCIQACQKDGSDCRTDQNFECLVGGIETTGEYACVLADSIVGTTCKTSQQCAAGTCQPDFPEGYCTRSCPNGTSDCLFPGVCVNYNAAAICARRCLFNSDCRPDYECKSVGSSATVCWPKVL